MRLMGGMHLYSFDIVVFLFGVCFNLAGLPLSAGFFSKEFLLSPLAIGITLKYASMLFKYHLL